MAMVPIEFCSRTLVYGGLFITAFVLGVVLNELGLHQTSFVFVVAAGYLLGDRIAVDKNNKKEQ